MNREDVIAAYEELLGRPPESEEVIQRAIQSGTDPETFRAGMMESPEYRRPQYLRDVANRYEVAIPEGEGVVPLAYTLATQTELDLPDYEVAGFTPDQEQAFQQARDLQGAYQPYLDAGYESTMQGLGAMGDALSGTRRLAGQIPGEVQAGQAALGQAEADTMRFAERGAADARQAADASYLVGDQARGIAADVTGRARSFLGPLESDLAQSTSGVREQAASGQAGADIAAQRARMSTAEAQEALQAASGFGLGSAQRGIAGLRGSSAMYTPDMIDPFMSSFEDAAVQQALSDIARQGELQEEQLASQAIQAGAYGGSRQAVAEQELARNIMEQQGRTAAQMRAQGFESAATRSQEAFERALARQQQEAQLTGQLGQIGAGSAASAAEAGGRLGLAAEELAQGSALQGAQLGLSGEQMASANAQALAQTGLSIEQLAGQTGLNAQQIAGQMAGQAGQLGMQAGQLGMQGAQQAGNLGLQSSQLGLSGIQAGLGAQQQAAGIGQGIAGIGQQQLGFGQAQQQLGQQDISLLSQVGQQQQAQQQAVMDAQRMNEYQQAMMPYQQLAFASDITTGAPTGITSVMSQPTPTPNPVSQAAGLAVAGASLFGQGGPFGKPA